MTLPNTWNGLEWTWPLVILGVVALVLILWSNWTSRISTPVRSLLTAAKVGALVLLGICLLEPMHSFSRPKPGANTIVVLADASRSLNVNDADATESRASLVKKQLSGDSPWLAELEQQFELRRYEFGSRVNAVTDFDDYDATGEGSAIVSSLQTVAERLKDRPSAGIILLTDGNASESLAEREAMDFEDLPPVYPVVVGGDRPAPDVSITSVETTQTNFESAPVTIKTELVAHGHAGDTVKVELLGKDNKSLEVQEVRRIEDGRPFAVRFQLKPTDRGVNTFQVRTYVGDPPAAPAAATDGTLLAQADIQNNRGEATLENNTRTVVVDRGRGPFRVLYVSGRPNWEYKFLRRAIEDDEELNLVGLLRVARKEPKFSFRGRTGESTNPLYRGFGNQDDATAEQYDEPVMIRLGTRDAAELRDGFPKDAKTLFEYDAIVLDDIEAKFFTQDQQTLISQFVNIRGGGLLMLGGMDSFAAGGFDRTRIGEMLPVYLDGKVAAEPDMEYRLELTREGWIQPWMRMESTRAADERRIAEMPAFKVINATRSIKPGASVLANVKATDGTTLPALVVQRFGKGRSAAMMIGDVWRWKLKSDKDNDDLYKSWRQTLRWLVSDVPRRVEIKVGSQRSTKTGGSLLAVQAYGEEFKPQLNSTVDLTVSTPSGNEIKLTADQNAKKAGQYTSSFVSRESGAYRVAAIVKSPEGNLVEERESGWVSEIAADEFRSLVPDRTWLEQIAEGTGGEVIELDDIATFAKSFENRKVPRTETHVEPWWHRWPIFLSAICLLVTEWGARRVMGLA